MTKIKCDYCKREFDGRSRSDTKHSFCSMNCYKNWQSERLRLNLDPRWLRRKYVDERLTIREISKLANCSYTPIYRNLTIYGIPKRRKGPRHIILTISPNDDLAYILGAVASDGEASYSPKRGDYKVQLMVKDKPFAEEFARRFRALGVAVPVYQCKNGYYCVSKSCKEIYDYCKKISLFDFSVLKTVSQKRNFIRGYYDGDGGLRKDRKNRYCVEIYGTVRGKIEHMASLLSDVGIRPHIYSQVYKTPWRDLIECHILYIKKRLDIIKFAKEIGSSIPRKKPCLALLNKKRYAHGYSEEEMLEWLREASAELGKSPSGADMKRLGAPTAGSYSYRFSSWNAAKKLAGLKTFEPGWVGMFQSKKGVVNLAP